MSQVSEGFGVKDIGLAITVCCSIGVLYFICDEGHNASFNVKTIFQKKILMAELSWMNSDATVEINMFLRATEMNQANINLGGFFDVNRNLFKSVRKTKKLIIEWLRFLMDETFFYSLSFFFLSFVRQLLATMVHNIKRSFVRKAFNYNNPFPGDIFGGSASISNIDSIGWCCSCEQEKCELLWLVKERTFDDNIFNL